MNIKRLAVCCLLTVLSCSVYAESKNWVGTWATAPEGAALFGSPPPAEALLGKTLRQIVNTSVGGEEIRVRLSNVDGTDTLTIAEARVALQESEAAILTGSDRPLAFDGQPMVTIPAGEFIWSDPVALNVQGLAMLAVSIYLPADATDPASPVTFNQYGLQTTYIGTGNQTANETLITDGASVEPVYWLTGIDVIAKKGTKVIAFLGDSLTDGFDALRLGPKNPFPSVLANRLANRPGANPNSNQQWGLLNVGISGNQVTASTLNVGAQERFERDVLQQSGVTHVFLYEGINDIGVPSLFGLPDIPAANIIAGLESLANRARDAGLKVIGATLTPFEGFVLQIVGPYFTQEGEAKRQAVNEWIRQSEAFDLVIDFDAAVRDPDAPTFIRGDLDGDGLHFNESGYDVIGSAIPLKALTTRRVLKK